MPTEIKALNVFLASPAGLEDERSAVDDVVKRINSVIEPVFNICLHLFRWEFDAAPSIGHDCQDVINRQAGSSIDIFIGLMRDRIGSPTPRADSGTIEEYERALKLVRRSGNTKIMFYFKDTIDSLSAVDPDQLQAVNCFKNKLVQDGVLYRSFKDSNSFERRIRDDLERKIFEFIAPKDKPNFFKDFTVEAAAKVGDEGSGASVALQNASLAIIHKGSVLIVKRSRYVKHGAGLWQLPGGKIEKGESALEAVCREIKEELGLDLDSEQLVSISCVESGSVVGFAGDRIKMHLFAIIVADRPGLTLEYSIDRVEWASLSGGFSRYELFGDTGSLLLLAKRHYYAYLPLLGLYERLDNSAGLSSLPKKLDGYSAQTTQIAESILGVLGFLTYDYNGQCDFKNDRQLMRVLLEWCHSTGSIFEANGNSDWQLVEPFISSSQQIDSLRRSIFENHASLATILSYKLGRSFGIRRVGDLLIPVRLNGFVYVLLRFDLYADKYQIPAKGLEKYFAEGKLDEKAVISDDIAKHVACLRFGSSFVDAFNYKYIDVVKTAHISSGSYVGAKYLKNYEAYVFSASIRKDSWSELQSCISSNNAKTEMFASNENVSSQGLIKNSYYEWADINDLMSSKYSFNGKKLQGFAELVDHFGKERLLTYIYENASDVSGTLY